MEVDHRNEKIGKKIREATLEKIPYMLVVGDRDMENGTVSLRLRSGEDKGAMSLADFDFKRPRRNFCAGAFLACVRPAFPPLADSFSPFGAMRQKNFSSPSAAPPQGHCYYNYNRDNINIDIDCYYYCYYNEALFARKRTTFPPFSPCFGRGWRLSQRRTGPPRCSRTPWRCP